jgi:hypothetical protein
VIGVSKMLEVTRNGTRAWRYRAGWPTRDGRLRTVSFSVAKYGEAKARRLAIRARRQGLEDLLGHDGTE